jgi:nucleosome binding factor SPN SPT16 subunit
MRATLLPLVHKPNLFNRGLIASTVMSSHETFSGITSSALRFRKRPLLDCINSDFFTFVGKGQPSFAAAGEGEDEVVDEEEEEDPLPDAPADEVEEEDEEAEAGEAPDEEVSVC